MEHNAFLDKPVFTTDDLVRQVGSDPMVLARYVRHFMMDKGKLRRYFKTLELHPLKETRRYLVYNVSPSLSVGKKMLYMRKGTLVFTDHKGKPILKRSCGNPMVASLPAIGSTASRFAPAKRQDAEVKLGDDAVTTMAESPDTMVTTSIQPSEFVEPEPGAPPAPPIPPAPPTFFTPPPFSPWPFLPIVPLRLHPPSNPPVPEPISILAFGAGLGGYSLVRRRRNRS